LLGIGSEQLAKVQSRLGDDGSKQTQQEKKQITGSQTRHTATQKPSNSSNVCDSKHLRKRALFDDSLVWVIMGVSTL